MTTDTLLDREVAVKRLHARLHGDEELEERFRREGRLVAVAEAIPAGWQPRVVLEAA